MAPNLQFFATFIQQNFLAWDWTYIAITLFDLSVASLLTLWASVFLWKTFRNQNFPEEFQLFLNTSFPREENPRVLKNKDALEAFNQMSNGEPIILRDGYAIHSSSLYSGIIKNSIESKIRPDLEIISTNFPITIDLQNIEQEDDFLYTDGPYKGRKLHYPHIFNITFKSSNNPKNWTPIIIKNSRIHTIVVEEEFRDLLIFENCWIGAINVQKRAPEFSTELSLFRCLIGNLRLNENSCSTLSINGGVIGQIYSSLSSEKSPIRDAFSIDEHAILKPDDAGQEIEKAHFRNFATHLRNKADLFSQQVVNSVVYRMEKIKEDKFMQFVNTCYRIFSNYNIRPGRPLLWMLFSTLFCAFLFYLLDSAMLTKDCPVGDGKANWIHELCANNFRGRIYRSFAIVFNNIINPLSAWSDKSLLQAKTFWLQLFLTLIGLLNLLWITLAVFSVKLRFSNKGSKSD